MNRNKPPTISGLYVIVGPDATRERPVVEVAEAALRGGARVLQLRDKTGDRGDVLPIAVRLQE
ncbi:MAG: thiamine phosphate synthase, partial [Chloroflexota bacterium]|nr:thiamine phosphate synthase [Chloroflexota bacterium]